VAAGPERAEPARGDDVRRVTNVGRPTMTVYPVAKAARPTPAVLVCPGGAYRILAIDKEGTEIAAWLNSIGVAAAVLKYRVPDNREGALQDAQRAMGLLRGAAKDWNIDPGRVGVMGFSAGGHLAARLSTNHQKRAYATVDAADRLSCRPDFTVLVYPAYLFNKERPREVVDEVVVTAATPPAFLVQTQDDLAHVDSSVAYYLALKKAGVRAEMHLFPAGGHGYGLRGDRRPAAEWPKLCEGWLRENGVVGPGR
jgi:acetyl esterase/lipase